MMPFEFKSGLPHHSHKAQVWLLSGACQRRGGLIWHVDNVHRQEPNQIAIVFTLTSMQASTLAMVYSALDPEDAPLHVLSLASAADAALFAIS